MKKEYRVAIVGCGAIHSVHGEALERQQNARLVAFCDIIQERAEAANKRFSEGKGAEYTDYGEMLEKESLDCVHICTPHYLHVPMAIQALEKGIAVFCEKPPAISRVQMEELESCVKAGGGKIGFCFQNRYNETVQIVKRICEGGRYGALLCMRGMVTWKRDADYYDSPWRGKVQYEGGSALINQAIHTLDLILAFMGEPVAVKASTQNHHLDGVIEGEDTAEVWMEFPTGKRACLYATTGYGTDAPVFLEFQFERGRATLMGNTVWVEGADGVMKQVNTEWQASSAKKYWGDGHRACIASFYEALEHNREFEIDLEAVQNTMDVLLSIYDT